MTKIEALFKWAAVTAVERNNSYPVQKPNLLLHQFTKFAMVSDYSNWAKGTIVKLIEDDGGILPKFETSTGNVYLYLSDIVPIELYEKETND